LNRIVRMLTQIGAGAGSEPIAGGITGDLDHKKPSGALGAPVRCGDGV
jgi:hypothetical protein